MIPDWRFCLSEYGPGNGLVGNMSAVIMCGRWAWYFKSLTFYQMISGFSQVHCNFVILDLRNTSEIKFGIRNWRLIMISIPPLEESFPDSKSKCSQSLFPTAIPMCPGSGNFDCSSWYYSAIGNAMRKGSKRIEVEKEERKAMARKKKSFSHFSFFRFYGCKCQLHFLLSLYLSLSSSVQKAVKILFRFTLPIAKEGQSYLPRKTKKRERAKVACQIVSRPISIFLK